MGKGAAFPDKGIYRGIKRNRFLTLPLRSRHKIDQMVSPMPFFIKGHGGFYRNAVSLRMYPVKHGGHISMIPDIVSASCIDRDSRNRRDLLLRFRRIAQCHAHNFHIIVHRDKRGDLRLQFVFLRTPFYCLPHQACRQRAFILFTGKFPVFRLRRRPRGRPAPGPLHDTPEIPCGSVIVQIFRADRL